MGFGRGGGEVGGLIRRPDGRITGLHNEKRTRFDLHLKSVERFLTVPGAFRLCRKNEKL